MEKAGFSWKIGRAVPVWDLGRDGRRKITLFPLSQPPRARHCYYNSDNDNNTDINM